jgi:hypothetical protein
VRVFRSKEVLDSGLNLLHSGVSIGSGFAIGFGICELRMCKVTGISDGMVDSHLSKHALRVKFAHLSSSIQCRG